MSAVDPRVALDELVGAVRDAQRRHAAGDTRALDSHMLAATLRQAEATLVRSDPRHGDPVGHNEIAGLVVAFKALVQRAGGHLEIAESKLLEARGLHAHVDADLERMLVELVDGPPPDTPRFDATWRPPA